jgi:hypothetical protein
LYLPYLAPLLSSSIFVESEKMAVGGCQLVAFLSLFLYGLVLIRLSMDISTHGVFEVGENGLNRGRSQAVDTSNVNKAIVDTTKLTPKQTENKKDKPTSPPSRKKTVSLSELASRVSSRVEKPSKEDANEESELDDEDDYEVDERTGLRIRETVPPKKKFVADESEEDEDSDRMRAAKHQATRNGNVEAVVEEEENNENDHALNGDDDLEEEDEEDDAAKKEEEEEETAPKQTAKIKGPTNWESFYESTLCRKYRSLPPGHAATKNVGQGQRSLCSRNGTEKRTVEYRTEIGGSLDISFQYKTIYIPVMKAGSQMFQEVFRRRLKGRRIYDRELSYYLKKYELQLEDFFIFTFVRNPLSTFVSAYGEVSKYSARNRTLVKGFASIEDAPDNEPKRALACLEDIKKGTFHGLIPAHMYPQLWKVSRCMSDRERTEVPVNFVGHLENLEEDWHYVERVLKLSHQDLPVIHSSSSTPAAPKRQLVFDPPSKSSRFSVLTKQVCEYYRADFVCFGYDDSVCRL